MFVFPEIFFNNDYIKIIYSYILKNMSNYEDKYLKYKTKYLQLKNQ